jgi:NDP-sugar pyrophosphorylase family protein
MNILILAAGQEGFNSHDGGYPLSLTEVDGIPVLERIIRSLGSFPSRNFIFALRQEDIRSHHLDSIAFLLAPGSNIVFSPKDTKGAACTALLAIKWLDNEEELLIVNGNEILDIDASLVIDEFRKNKFDAGTIIFPSIHPRYSYVRLDDKNLVIEAAEKKPISKNATAGFYWFSTGKNFIRAAQSMIRKDAHVNGSFYIAPIFNEMVLDQAKIGVYQISAERYHPIKTERQLHQLESSFEAGRLR